MTMVIDGSNGITFPDTSKQYNSYYNFKNRIINGAMVIDQRNAGAAVTGSGEFPVDRFLVGDTTDGAFSAQQDSSAPAGFINSVKITVTTADATLTTTQLLSFQHRIEGTNVADFGWGTANAQTVTLSFWVRSSLTGAFGGALRNSANNRSYPFTYTISAANTWEQKSVTIAGDTSGTWLTTNGVGIRIFFGLGGGPDVSGTAGAWNSNNNSTVTGAVSVVGTSGATFYITGVQLEKGTQATSFDYRAYGTELALCQRYYAKSYNQSTVPGSNAGTSNSVQALNGTDGNQIQGFRTPVTMRASATARIWTLSGTLASLSTTSEVDSGINNGSWSPYGMGDQGCRAIVGTGGLSSGVAYVYHWDASAEL
jgi:hypothetical protein